MKVPERVNFILWRKAKRLAEHLHIPLFSKDDFKELLYDRTGFSSHAENAYGYHAITVRLTGDYRALYERFCARQNSAERHPGHAAYDCYPEQS